MKKTGFTGYVYDFSVHYDATNVDDILDIHKYLMKKITVFFVGLTILSDFTNAISMNNQECKTRPQVVNVNGDEPVFFPFSIRTSKCSVSCKSINYPYATFVFLML